MKRIICLEFHKSNRGIMIKVVMLLLICALVLTSVAVPNVAFAAVSSDNDSDYMVDTLIGLGILSDTDSDKYKPMANVKKYQLVNYIYSMLGDYSVGSGVNDDASLFLEGIGVIDSAQSINASEQITREQAVKMLVVALGYGEAAKYDGGYPTGYMHYAAKLGLLKGVSATGDDKLKMYDVVTLLYNAIECEAAVITDISEKSTKYKTYDGVSIIALNRGIYKTEGVMTADYYSTLYGESSLAKGTIKIGDIIYNDADYSKNMLGYPVVAYFRQERGAALPSIIYMQKDTNSYRELTIDAEDISYVSDDLSEIRYYDKAHGDTERVVRTALPKVIFNGQAYPECTASELKIQNGSLTLLDSDNNGGYDIIIAESYKVVFVDNCNTSSKTITNLFGGESIDTDVKKNNGELIIKNKDSVLKLSDIRKYDVLYVKMPKSKERAVIEIFVSADRRSGAATALNITEKKIGINNTEYTLSDSFVKEYEKNGQYAKVSLGTTYTIFLTPDGKVAAVKKDDSGIMKYGYAINVALDNDFDKKMKIKLFDANGEWKIYELEDKVKHNGTNGKTSEKIYGEITNSDVFEPQLIEYALNKNGKINILETRVNDDGDTNSGRLRAKTAYGEYRYNDNSVDSKYYFDNANYWILPSDEYKYDENSYRITTDRYYLNKDEKYSFVLYKLDEYDFTQNVTVMLDNADEMPTGSLFLVSEVEERLDSDGNIVQTIVGGYQTYDKIMLSAEDQGVFDGVNKGDIITINTNAAGNVPLKNGLKIQYSLSDGEKLERGGDIYTKFCVSKGKIVQSDAENNRFTVNLGASGVVSRRWFDAPNILIYYKEKGNIERGDSSSLQVGDYIVYREFWASITDIIIIRD